MVIGLDYALALVSGALLALSFPRYGHPALAWIALVPLLVALTGWEGRGPSIVDGRPAACRETAARAFLLGLATGLRLFHRDALLDRDRHPHVRRNSVARGGARRLSARALPGIFPGALSRCSRAVSSRAAARPPSCCQPAAWVATEFFRGVVFGGFPWVLLGDSQVTVLPVAQLASVLGVYGVSALVAFVNASIAYAVLCDRPPSHRGDRRGSRGARGRPAHGAALRGR